MVTFVVAGVTIEQYISKPNYSLGKKFSNNNEMLCGITNEVIDLIGVVT